MCENRHKFHEGRHILKQVECFHCISISTLRKILFFVEVELYPDKIVVSPVYAISKFVENRVYSSLRSTLSQYTQNSLNVFGGPMKWVTDNAAAPPTFD